VESGITYSDVNAIDVETFTLPENLGKIKYKYQGSSNKTIIHIQDAHCNYACQQKITEILDYINKEYRVNTVNLEGGVTFPPKTVPLVIRVQVC